MINEFKVEHVKVS